MYNYNYVDDNWENSLLKNYKNSFRNVMNMSNNSLVTPSVGYDRGNLFGNLYDQYKNYQPDTLRASNEKERLFLELSIMSFAAHEVNLYLDVNPDDTSMIKLFNDYRTKANELISEYESKYGPISIKSDSLDQIPFMWEKGPWPWEDDKNVQL